MVNELYTDKYCPKSIKEFVGFNHQSILKYIENVIKGAEKKKGFIMYGSPGTGKSTLANLLSSHFNISQYYTNASDERKKSQINVDVFRTESLKNKKTLIIFDECDGLSKSAFKELERVIKRYVQPTILVCNDITKIPYGIKSICYQENFSIDHFTLLALANRVVKAESLDLPRLQIKDIVDQSTSFRSLLHALQFGIGSHPPKQLSPDLAVLYSLQGQNIDLPTNDLANLIVRFNDASNSPHLISLADIWESRYRNGYTHGKNIVKAILSSIRTPGIKKLNYPRTYKLLYESKHGKKMKSEAIGEKKSNKPRIRILGFK